ncbi:uncharacterized protein Dwil_GK11276 [Drosophila willistoni]|uniref:Protein krueppel n=1 Tax=Drosophila willistoni TaxID=7260 RepID=B4NB07_DROWI|nr:transcription factor Ouib isoform X1 [Drosophila willistoni]EDW80971.1 uncharacterized protein Dwil_GK11276 [Drosophila willistoni]
MLQNVCRVCSRRTDDKTAQSLFVTKAHKLISQINLLTGIVLEPADDLPDLICPMCQKNLKRFIGFRKLCLRSQKKFENHREVKCVVKPQNRAADTHIVCVRRSGRKQNQLEQHETGDTYMKEEPIEVLIKVEHTQDINNDKVEEVDTLDDDIDRLDTTSNNSKHAEKDKEFISLSDEDEEKWLTDEEEDELYLPPAHTLPKRRRHRHQDKTSSEKPPKNLPVFFCDQCGHNVTGKTNFDRHIRKHSGIRPFQCQLCPSRFLSAGELKGHQVSHTGDRNFPCRFCDRSYVNHSGRLRHERTHTNERPFVCSQCGKSFTNSYILKNHILIHTGERLFRCELCQRSFARPTHLTTHYRSNTHKQNVEKSKMKDANGPKDQNNFSYTVERASPEENDQAN